MRQDFYHCANLSLPQVVFGQVNGQGYDIQ